MVLILDFKIAHCDKKKLQHSLLMKMEVISEYFIGSWEFIYSQVAGEGPVDRKLLSTEEDSVSRRIRVMRHYPENAKGMRGILRCSGWWILVQSNVVFVKTEFYVKGYRFAKIRFFNPE